MGYLLRIFVFAMLSAATLGAFGAVFVGCAPARSVEISACDVTCAHWAALGCEEALPSPEKRVSCSDVCARTEEFEPLPHVCIRASNSCAEARECR